MVITEIIAIKKKTTYSDFDMLHHDMQVAKEAVDRSQIIQEDVVEIRPEMVSSSCMDENV